MTKADEDDREPRQFGYSHWMGAKHASCQECARTLGAAWVPIARIGVCDGCEVELEPSGVRVRLR